MLFQKGIVKFPIWRSTFEIFHYKLHFYPSVIRVWNRWNFKWTYFVKQWRIHKNKIQASCNPCKRLATPREFVGLTLMKTPYITQVFAGYKFIELGNQPGIMGLSKNYVKGVIHDEIEITTQYYIIIRINLFHFTTQFIHKCRLILIFIWSIHIDDRKIFTLKFKTLLYDLPTLTFHIPENQTFC